MGTVIKERESPTLQDESESFCAGTFTFRGVPNGGILGEDRWRNRVGFQSGKAAIILDAIQQAERKYRHTGAFFANSFVVNNGEARVHFILTRDSAELTGGDGGGLGWIRIKAKNISSAIKAIKEMK